jgi:glycosyltransferase involved in cell wall biosynthesis
MSVFRVAVVVSHPIQHFCPQYVSFAENKDVTVKVFFASMLGFKKYLDPNFKKEISWGNLNLDKFDHQFLNGEEVIQSDKHIDAPSLDNALSEFKPDFVIVYGYFQKLQRRAHAWAKKHQVPMGYISDSELRQKRSPWKEMLKTPYVRWYFSNINYFLSVGDANEAYYRKYGVPDKKIVRMHFPIDLKYYEQSFPDSPKLAAVIRNQYNIEPDDNVLSIVGKLVSWKSQDHVIDALQLLEKRGIYAHLLLIGSGEMQEAWQEKAARLIKSKVHFTGFINVEALPAYYAATDIYIQPSSVEPHSIAVSEAVYMGCPVIISDRCGSYGQDDDVQENKNGWVYPFGNIETLADKIEHLIKDNALRKDFSSYSHASGVRFQAKSHHQILQKIREKVIENKH